jgi:Virulence-associated protein E/Bifunctional DNA primase/polymerase, N-terminal
MSMNLTVALQMAAAGIPVFPMHVFKDASGKWIKKPAIKGWRTEATTDVETIERWGREFPQAVFGIELEMANLVAIDCDRHREDADGCEAFKAIVEANGASLPRVPVTQTSGGGWHFFFRQPDVPIRCPVKTGLPPAVEVKGAGGNIVVPGSMRCDGAWWRPLADNGRPTLAHAYRNGLAVIPPWLEKLARKKVEPPEPQPQPRPKRKSSRGASGKRERAYAKAALDGQCQKVAGMPANSGRNKALNAAAFVLGRMVAREWIDESEVKGALLDAARRCGLVKDEGADAVQATIASGLKAGLKQPHGNLKDKPNGQEPGPQENPAEPGPPKPSDDYDPKPPPEPLPEPPPDWPDLGGGGKPSRTCANARKAIEVLGIECRYDVFHDRMLVGGHAIEQWAGELSDHACQMLRVMIKTKFGFDPGRENTHDAAVQLCLKRQFDPARDYLDGLRWDGVRRLDRWVTTYLGADDTELTRAIGRLTLVAAVRRVRQPGCKFDQIVVLEGLEGSGKSTAIEILAGKENFSDQTILGLNDREQQEAVRGIWLYEIADLAGMSKADVDRTKAFASRLSDRARPAYARAVVALARRCIFIATTNNETYLKSQTGNRRFWPVKTGEIDLAALKRDRDQLWAEAAKIEATGLPLKLAETLWSTAAIEQDKRRDPDPWDEMLANVKGTVCDSADGRGKEERISTTELLKVHLNLPADKCTDAAAKRLGYCMRRLEWEKPEGPIRVPGVSGKVRGFRRPMTRGQ